MTKALAMEWGPHGVRCKSVSPGVHSHRFGQRSCGRSRTCRRGPRRTPRWYALGRPEDMIGAAIFLRQRPSAFMTGQILYVDRRLHLRVAVAD